MIKFKYNKEKAVEMMIYIVSKVNSCDKHQLMKTCFFADLNHLENYGRPVTGNKYIKMNYGPVPSEVYGMIQRPLPEEHYIQVDGYYLRALREANIKKLSKSDIKSIDYAIELLSDMDFQARTEVSHGHAWQSAELNQAISFEAMLEEIGDKDLMDYVRGANVA
ncbi:TPA: Panacea domain-containing protein [Photobacterium damselae]|uniref:Antitoxin SocA-like Panacea domain-containing protein n=1 Tax=Vibrio metoecus TaxID=1481663 RepID=A0A0Q0LYN9_VIBMT|nr:Panacea domain-containing protein [Vibrio metoecus]KQA22644.1 hypothetical protein AAY55_16370 [Vibrio metoecus]